MADGYQKNRRIFENAPQGEGADPGRTGGTAFRIRQSLLAAALFFAGTFLCGLGLLRLMAWGAHKRKQRLERTEDAGRREPASAEPVRLAEALAGEGIPSCRQELGDAGFAAARYGMGKGADGRIVVLVPEERAQEAAGIVEGMGLACSFPK